MLAGLKKLQEAMGRVQPGKVARDAWQRMPANYAGDPRNNDMDPSPVANLFNHSPGASLFRQGLSKANLPGGYSKSELNHFKERRKADPEVKAKTLELGDFSDIEGLPEVGETGRKVRMAAQIAGQLGRDVTTQGALGIWWMINAPEVISLLGTQTATRGALRSKGGPIPRQAVSPQAEKDGTLGRNPFRMSGSAVMGLFPAIAGASIATGTYGRQEGYKAVLPDPEDQTESRDPLYEGFLRLTGRKGGLLPYSKFVEERPDVSKEGYDAYQSYRSYRGGVLKATDSEVHGPEVSFMGRSIPLLTGIVPLAAAALGARRGVRMAGNRIAGRGVMGKKAAGSTREDMFAAVKPTREEVRSRTREMGSDDPRTKQAKADLYGLEKNIQYNLIGGAAAGSAAGLTVGAAAGSILENIRRANQAEENRKKALQQQAEEARNTQVEKPQTALADLIPVDSEFEAQLRR